MRDRLRLRLCCSWVVTPLSTSSETANGVMTKFIGSDLYQKGERSPTYVGNLTGVPIQVFQSCCRGSTASPVTRCKIFASVSLRVGRSTWTSASLWSTFSSPLWFRYVLWVRSGTGIWTPSAVGLPEVHHQGRLETPLVSQGRPRGDDNGVAWLHATPGAVPSLLV